MKKCVIGIILLSLVWLCACGRNGDNESVAGVTESVATEAWTDSQKYEYAMELMDNGDYYEAITAFSSVAEYGDSMEKMEECRNLIVLAEAESLEKDGMYEQALDKLMSIAESGRATEALSSYYRVIITEVNFYEYFSVVSDPEGGGYRIEIADAYASKLARLAVTAEFMTQDTMQSACVSLTMENTKAALFEDAGGVGEAELASTSGELIVYLPRQDALIPQVYLEGAIRSMSIKSDVRIVHIRYEDQQRSFDCYAKIKLQGNSSLGYRKKNYTVKLYRDPECEEKFRTDLGWGAQNEYCLKANWIDKTHARNIVTARLAGQINEKYGLHEDAPANGAIDGFPVEVSLNGAFLGLYTLNIPKDAWMFGMDSDNPEQIVLCAEERGDTTGFKAEPDLEKWSVETGEENEETLSKLIRLTDFIKNSSDAEFRDHLSEYMSLDALLNYYIMVDFAWMADNVTKNMLLVTYDGNIWIPTLYDLDTSWGSHWMGRKLYPYEEENLYMRENYLFERLERLYAKELAERYFELRGEILSKENILDMFNSFASLIPEELLQKEKAVWGCEIPGFGVDQIEAYLDVMIPRLDQKYGSLLPPGASAIGLA